MKEKRVAIVYDWFDSWGGAERVLQELIKIYPDADLYTSFYDRRRARWIPEEKRSQIHTSFLQKFPSWMLRRKKLLTILFPIAFESFDLSGYDLVVSVSSSFAKGVITRPETLHLCYLLTPTRFLWLYPDEYLGKLTRRLCAGLISYLHKWDLIAAQRPDRYIVISDTVRTRLKTIYGRDGDVLYPPLALSYWKALEKTAPRRRLPDNFFPRCFSCGALQKTGHNSRYFSSFAPRKACCCRYWDVVRKTQTACPKECIDARIAHRQRAGIFV
ncbi:MAG: hypothetical protein UZ21_OP11001000026 [Microgenomates bacterium OLB22]|nr:MAG: hypothetical protein UZ21_OP11001000026 [Microgenomates bacterium OLB22]